MRRILVLASAERCAVHGVSWYAQSDDPWYAAEGATLEQAIGRFVGGAIRTAARNVERNGQWESKCTDDLAVGDPSAVPGAVLVFERDVNVVGLPHATFAFWADRSRYDEPQPCGCVPLGRVLDVLRENGVEVKET